MISLSNIFRTLDAGVHAAHSGMVIGQELHELALGHINLEVILAAYVLGRFGLELARLAGKGWRRLKAWSVRRKQAIEAAPEPTAPAAG